MSAAPVNESGNEVRLGFYGKLPMRGDFVGRGLDPTFVDAWHDWIEASIATSRQQLGEAWQPRYLAAPLWRFLIGPGICGSSGAAGVLMASVDRVGRCFPLVLATSVSRFTASLRAMKSAQPWFEAIEDLALSALAEDLDPEIYDARLHATAPPPLTVPAGDGTGGLGIVLGDEANSPGIAVADIFLANLTERYSLWWTAGASNFPPVLVASRGLPAPEGFSALLDGEWRRWGWTIP